MWKTNRLTLRQTTLHDADQIEKLASDYDVAKTTLTIPHPYPVGAAVDFITNMLALEEAGKIIVYSIIENDSDEFIGFINLTLNPIHQRGELGYWIGKPYWRKGYGTEATQAVIHVGFTHLNLNKIFAQAFAHNLGSWRIMEKVGMAYEGTLKQHCIRFGNYIDIVQYGLLKADYIGS